jgi:hypothetical protein
MDFALDLRSWVAQRFTAAIQTLNFDGFSRWGTVSFKLIHHPPLLTLQMKLGTEETFPFFSANNGVTPSVSGLFPPVHSYFRHLVPSRRRD